MRGRPPWGSIAKSVLGRSLVSAAQPFRQQTQAPITATERFKRRHGCQHVVTIRPRLAMTLTDQMQLLGKPQSSGVLRMTMIDHVDERRHLPAPGVEQRDPAHSFAIDVGHLFTRAQITDGLPPIRRADPIGNATTGAPAVEAKHEPGFLRRATMDEGVDAQGAMEAIETRRDAVEKGKTRLPDQ